MDFGEKLKRYVELKNIYKTNQTFNGNENLLNDYQKLHKEFYSLYMELRLRTGIDPGNEFNFDRWVFNEHKQMTDIENLINDDFEIDESNELDIHLENFDKLGFDNQNIYNWRKSILEALEQNNYKMSDFYFTKYNSNNKDLLQHIALKSETYNFLNSKGLINRGFCPITGEKINNTVNYNIYGRSVYLSSKGIEICKKIDKNEWNNENSKVDYDTFQELRQQTAQKTKSQVKLITLILGVISLIISWYIVSPSGFFSFIGFLLLGVVFFYVLGWIFNILFDMFYR